MNENVEPLQPLELQKRQEHENRVTDEIAQLLRDARHNLDHAQRKKT